MPSGTSDLPIQNVPFVEELYAAWLRDESAVDPAWRAYFEQLGRTPAFATGPSFTPGSIFAGRPGAQRNGAAKPGPARGLSDDDLQDRVTRLVQAYRFRGHLFADLDPLDLKKPTAPDISLGEFGLHDADLDRSFTVNGLRGTLRELIAHCEETYCRHIGAEVAHLEAHEQRIWLRDAMEGTRNRLALSRDEQLELLTKLTDAEVFERFLGLKFQGAKRFSLEGGESLIPLLDRVIGLSAQLGVDEAVIGMAHRGRLNALANVLEKPARDIFAEFEDKDPNLYLGHGDVKYHLGHSTDREFGGRKVHLTMAFNPSHLEYVDPVVMGRVRAKQDRSGDATRRRVLSLLVHGDAAFAGQGIVAECFNMAGLRGFTVGGTIHVVVNNQVGFTTDPSDSRSTRYCTDIAKILSAPILHVNGEDPEAVAQVAKLAVEFRHRFQTDVVIDLYCFRKHGHNETDEPLFTQPLMYKAIAARPTVRDQYVKKLTATGRITQAEADAIQTARRDKLEAELAQTRAGLTRRKPSAMAGLWAKYAGGPEAGVKDVDTGVPMGELQALGRALASTPPGFTTNPKLQKNLLYARDEMVAGKRALDWGMAECLAYATLVSKGVPIRLTGQDVERGTFSHRHAALVDFEGKGKFNAIGALVKGEGRFELHNSPLSEVSVLGYEYGYSLDTPEGLTIWEAQFGDFVNSAQVIADQFIVSGDDKWHRLSGLVLLLPHGYEGGGPEHSSARLERWLASCAGDNLQVVNATTPAQIFHLLRRQVLRPWRKPLVVMSPKSLLRHPDATSTLEELSVGTFRRVIPDVELGAGRLDGQGVTRVLFCSGKIYYELAKARTALGREDVAIARVEQLAPTPFDGIDAVLRSFPNAKEAVWVQEEPMNQGAWLHLRTELERHGTLRLPLRVVARAPSGSPATGSHKSHEVEQRRLHEAAFAPEIPAI